MPDLVVYDVKICEAYNLGTEAKFENLKATFVSHNAFIEEVLNAPLQPHCQET